MRLKKVLRAKTIHSGVGISLILLPLLAASAVHAQKLKRTDLFVESDPRVRIFVREVVGPDTTGVPVLLVHGGGPGGLASFDLPVHGYSLAVDLARAGHPTYIMNVRGWEHSTRPPALSDPPEANPPQVQTGEAARDIRAALDLASERRGGREVTLFGWATGGQWGAYLAANNSEGISGLITLNSLTPTRAPWELEDAFTDPSGAFAGGGAYRLRTLPSFISGWDASIPTQDKTDWRDPAVAGAYALTALEADPTAYDRSPPSARIPLGYREESLRLARGEQLWNLASIRIPYLAIRGERDFWSRPADLEAVEQEVTAAPRVETLTIPGATHYLFIDRPTVGRGQFLRRVRAFLASL